MRTSAPTALQTKPAIDDSIAREIVDSENLSLLPRSFGFGDLRAMDSNAIRFIPSDGLLGSWTGFVVY